MMRRQILIFAMICGILMIYVIAQAQEKRDEYGIGIILGEPSGLNAQFFAGRSSTVDLTIAWSWHDRMFLSADYQIYDYILDSPREWKWWYGGGVYMQLSDEKKDHLGLRIPLGIRYSLPHSNFDVWAELAPGLELIDDTEPVLQGGLGATFWLK